MKLAGNVFFLLHIHTQTVQLLETVKDGNVVLPNRF